MFIKINYIHLKCNFFEMKIQLLKSYYLSLFFYPKFQENLIISKILGMSNNHLGDKENTKNNFIL
jgi:hypothetical protein